MLGLLVLNGVGGKVYCTDVVTVDQRALEKRAMELCKELPDLGGLSHAVGDSAVPHLGTGAGGHWLALG
jgi:hypothetical protein